MNDTLKQAIVNNILKNQDGLDEKRLERFDNLVIVLGLLGVIVVGVSLYIGVL